MGKTTGQISKETEDFNNTINQLDLTDRHLQNTPLNDIRIHIILKCIWNILQDTPYVRP